VTQNAQAASGSQQTRVFSYDLLGRVKSESNPETSNSGSNGTTQYTYDVACTTTPASPGDLTKRIDNAGNSTCYAYDALHRVTNAGFNHVCRRYRYDTSVTPPTGIAVTNTKGRLLEAKTDNCSGTQYTDEWFGYTGRGELADFYEATPQTGTTYFHTTTSYWPTGTPHALSGIQSVPTIYYGASDGSGLDGEGRVTKVTAGSGQNPVTAVTYSTSSTSNVLGALTGVTYGSLDGDTFTFDPDTGRPLTYGASVNGQSDTGTLTWNTNGTLASLNIVDSISGTKDSQNCTSFTYDDLGRATGVNCGTTGSQSYTYDPFGNITKAANGIGASFQPASYSANDQPIVSGMLFDTTGNTLADNLGNTYTWDPNWGNVVSVDGNSVTYDAFGRMVELHTSSGYSELVYSALGKIAIMNGTTLTKAFVPLPGGGTAIYNPSGLSYYRHADWLGSSRLTSTSGRALYSSIAYAPFGDQYATSGTAADPSFTGQNSDTSSALYDFPARRQSPSQGRWISPDPAGFSAADPSNPQSWNRYAYVLNNPSLLTDPSGLCPPAARNGWQPPCGGSEGGGDCTLDGIYAPCDWAISALESGAGMECPGGDCGPYTGSNGFLYEIVATTEGWQYVNPATGNLFAGGSEFGLPSLPDDPLDSFEGDGAGPATPASGTPGNPCRGANPNKLDYQSANGKQHILQNHATGGKGPGIYAGDWTAILLFNQATLTMGSRDPSQIARDQRQGTITLLWSAPQLPWPLPLLWTNNIGWSSPGQPTPTNRLVVRTDCTTVITSYPVKP
jgi:RHS repeat-associated protein